MQHHPALRDVLGGITTFFTMAYIVVVNPAIRASPATGMPFSGVLTATVLITPAMTLMMRLYARLPFARGAGYAAQRVLRLHDRPAATRPVAGRSRNGLLGRRALPARVRHAGARSGRDGDP